MHLSMPMQAKGGKRGARRAAVAAAEAAGAGATRHARTEFGKSSAVFAKIQEQADAANVSVLLGRGLQTARYQRLSCCHR